MQTPIKDAFQFMLIFSIKKANRLSKDAFNATDVNANNNGWIFYKFTLFADVMLTNQYRGAIIHAVVFLVLIWSSFASFMWLNQTFPRICQYSFLRMPALPFYGRYQRTGEKSQHGSWIDRQRRYNCEVNKNCFDSKMAWRTYYAKPVPLLKCYKMLFFRFETKIRIIVLICPKSRFSSKSFITLSTN